MSDDKYPKLSVIMSVFNDEKYLPDAIESIIGQTFKDFEFIICNDCSKDDSYKIISKYKKMDNRIKIINNDKNIGLAASLNKCLALAKGEYIARMDSDDISLPNRFKEEVNFLEKNSEYSVISTQAYYIDENGNQIGASKIKSGKVDFEASIKASGVMHPTVMMRKEVLDDVNGYTVNKNTQRAEDYDLWCKITEKGNLLYVMDSFLFKYRVDLEGIKKRKYKYRIQESKIKYYWFKRSESSIQNIVYCIKPLIIGLIPKKIVLKFKYR